ncbi:uncharacterized protein LOC113147168 [Cyclospora cayetanensis]|uniref:Uncharacterized protein LOC113147168 n=1 Tax=Cyclospora cayetanensis TaxID=88456 RepID=A0A6P6RYZ3_9EIME|nr:uncharacterized protein LOC113147168 [Cyclospora cayetanensis]
MLACGSANGSNYPSGNGCSSNRNASPTLAPSEASLYMPASLAHPLLQSSCKSSTCSWGTRIWSCDKGKTCSNCSCRCLQPQKHDLRQWTKPAEALIQHTCLLLLLVGFFCFSLAAAVYRLLLNSVVALARRRTLRQQPSSVVKNAVVPVGGGAAAPAAAPPPHLLIVFNSNELLLLAAAEAACSAAAATAGAAAGTSVCVQELLLPAVVAAFLGGLSHLTFSDAPGVCSLKQHRQQLVEQLQQLSLEAWEETSAPQQQQQQEQQQKNRPLNEDLLVLHSPILICVRRGGREQQRQHEGKGDILKVRLLCGCSALPELLNLYAANRLTRVSRRNCGSFNCPSTHSRNSASSSGQQTVERESNGNTLRQGMPRYGHGGEEGCKFSPRSELRQQGAGAAAEQHVQDDCVSSSNVNTGSAHYTLPSEEVIRASSVYEQLLTGGDFPVPRCLLRAELPLLLLLRSIAEVCSTATWYLACRVTQGVASRLLLRQDASKQHHRKAYGATLWELPQQLLLMLQLLLPSLLGRLQEELSPFGCLTPFSACSVPPLLLAEAELLGRCVQLRQHQQQPPLQQHWEHREASLPLQQHETRGLATRVQETLEAFRLRHLRLGR